MEPDGPYEAAGEGSGVAGGGDGGIVGKTSGGFGGIVADGAGKTFGKGRPYFSRMRPVVAPSCVTST